MLKVSPLQHICNSITFWLSMNSTAVALVAVENKNFLVYMIHPPILLKIPLFRITNSPVFCHLILFIHFEKQYAL